MYKTFLAAMFFIIARLVSIYHLVDNNSILLCNVITVTTLKKRCYFPQRNMLKLIVKPQTLCFLFLSI